MEEMERNEYNCRKHYFCDIVNALDDTIAYNLVTIK